MQHVHIGDDDRRQRILPGFEMVGLLLRCRRARAWCRLVRRRPVRKRAGPFSRDPGGQNQVLFFRLELPEQRHDIGAVADLQRINFLRPLA